MLKSHLFIWETRRFKLSFRFYNLINDSSFIATTEMSRKWFCLANTFFCSEVKPKDDSILISVAFSIRHATFPEYPGIPEYELLKFHFPDLLKVLFW